MKVYSEMTFQAWQTLLDLTTERLDLASSYWTLRGEDVYQHPSDWQGEWIFRELVKGKLSQCLKKGRSQFVLRKMINHIMTLHIYYLGTLPNIQVKALNFDRLIGAGIYYFT